MIAVTSVVLSHISLATPHDGGITVFSSMSPVGDRIGDFFCAGVDGVTDGDDLINPSPPVVSRLRNIL